MPARSICLFALLLVVGLSAPGCETRAPSSNSTPSAQQAERSPASSKLGAPLRGSQKVSLADIAKSSSRYANATVTTEGRVTAVCQAMGCWMEIGDANGEAHVRMSGHSFFIPKTAAGRRAVVEGIVLAKPDDGQCEQEALQATGKPVKVELDATGVELL